MVGECLCEVTFGDKSEPARYLVKHPRENEQCKGPEVKQRLEDECLRSG